MYSKLASSITTYLLLLNAICHNCNGQSTNYQARATFSQYAMGHVTVINGHLMIELDVSNVDVGNDTLGIPANCFDDGVSYHIHSEWNHDDMMDRQGTTDCGAGSTGGHWDPWFACSDNSDGVDCKINGGCIWGSSAVEVNGSYQCSTDTWDSHGYACEVSDFSGKYGMASVSSNEISEYSSHWMEIDGIDFDDDLSIVFHCGDGSRAFCAPFNVTMDADTEYEREMGDDTATIDFDGFSYNDVDFDGTEIQIGNGWVEVTLADDVVDACQTWFVRVYGGWEHDSSDAQANNMCNLNYTHGIWDPTHSCIDDSDSMYCDDGVRCPGTTATNVDYDCDNEEDALGCAIGDITGRIAEINAGNDGKYSERFDDRISMHLDQLAGKSIVLECTRLADITDSGIFKVCKGITSSDLSLSSSSKSNKAEEMTAGGVFGIIIVLLLAFGIGFAYFKGKPTDDPNSPQFALTSQSGQAPEVVRMTNTLGATTTAGGTLGAATVGAAAMQGSQVPTTVAGENNTNSAANSSGYNPVGNASMSNIQNPNNSSSNMNNNVINTNNLSVGDGAIEVADRSPSASPAMVHTPQDIITPQGSASPKQTNGKLPPPPKHRASRSSQENEDKPDTQNVENVENVQTGQDEQEANLNSEGGYDMNNIDTMDNMDNVDINENESDNMMGNESNHVTAGGMPPPPMSSYDDANAAAGADDNGVLNDDEAREDTPDQPATNFEEENGQLPIDELGDPQM